MVAHRFSDSARPSPTGAMMRWERPSAPRPRERLSNLKSDIIGQTLMPQTPHIERHFTGSETVKDIVIGMADGLTVPFALAAGLSGAIETTSIIITAGLADIADGSIAMGLGGCMDARRDEDH